MHNLYEDLQAGVHTAMQRYLIQSLVNKNIFWPVVAFHLGFTPPGLNIDDLGTKSAFFIPTPKARTKTFQRCGEFATIYRESIENELIDDSMIESHDLYDILIYKWNHRFDFEDDISKWIGDTQMEWINDLQSKGISSDRIKTQVDEEFDTLKLCFDNVFNMLIFFAVKHVTHELRVLFRAIFQHNEDTNYLFFQLEPFDCKITVLKTDIPPPSHHFPAQTPTPNSKKRKGMDHTPSPVTPMATLTTH
jgi:hypothetical protein